LFRLNRPVLSVPHTRPFEITGLGDHPAWQKAEPMPMLPRGGHEVASHRTWFKALWTAGGVYFLIDCGDQKLVATQTDNQALWNEDVAEVFIWPDEKTPIYYEYNISPLGADVQMLVPHIGDDYRATMPFSFDSRRHVQKAVSVRGGPQSGGADITGWTCEFFISSRALRPLPNRRPDVGVQWRANLFRIDYDHPHRRFFSWHDVGPSFHNHIEYPTLRFV
jgi:hypothetical protein